VVIGLPVYNGERHLRASVESVLGQTFADLALVIADNASTDATGEIAKEYAASDPRVRVETSPVNVGARQNFHRVFALAGPSEYFKWQGHDDVLRPTYVERCVEHLDQHTTAAVCQTAIVVVDGEDRDLGAGPRPISFCGPTPHERLRAFYAHPKAHQTIFGLMRRSALEATGLFGPWFSSDRALLMELALHGCFGRLDEPLFVHREHTGRGDYVRDKVGWYMPERLGAAELAYWPHLRRTASILATTPMSAAERARCVRELARRATTIVGPWAATLPREAATAAFQAARRARG
jgi:hypothetical protein